MLSKLVEGGNRIGRKSTFPYRNHKFPLPVVYNLSSRGL